MRILIIIMFALLIALPALATKFCPDCGQEFYDPDYKICPDCGVGLLELGWVCEECGAKVAVGYDFCPGYGAPKPGTEKPPEKTKRAVEELYWVQIRVEYDVDDANDFANNIQGNFSDYNVYVVGEGKYW